MDREEMENLISNHSNRITAIETALPYLATKEQLQKLIAEQIMNRFLLGGVLLAVVANIILTWLHL